MRIIRPSIIRPSIIRPSMIRPSIIHPSIIVSIVLMLAGVAHAQRAPDLATLDRGDGISKFGLDLSIVSIDTPYYDAALRFEPHGQYVTQSGFGIYGAFPITKSFGDSDNPMDPEPALAIGNLELGGLFVITNSPRVSWVFRLGVAIPTASDDRDGAATNSVALWPRLTDAALAIPDAWYVRAAFSPLFHVDRLFLQFDLGLDIGTGDNNNDSEFLRLNLGGGIDLGVVALSLELANLYAFNNDNDNWVHTLAFTLRFMGEKWQPFLSLGAPIDDSRDSIKFFLTGGITFAP
jgi:hypothetical protein